MNEKRAHVSSSLPSLPVEPHHPKDFALPKRTQANPLEVGTCALLCRESPVYVKALCAFILGTRRGGALPSQVLCTLSVRLKLASTMATFCNRSSNSAPRLHQKRSQSVRMCTSAYGQCCSFRSDGYDPGKVN